MGDITYIPTGEGWLYLAIVKDLCTRKIVGYAFSDRIDTQLTMAALDMAYRRRKPPKGLIFHSDRGVQYAARAFRDRLSAYGFRQSMSRRGDPYDNAVAENFFSCLILSLILYSYLSIFSSLLVSVLVGRAQFYYLSIARTPRRNCPFAISSNLCNFSVVVEQTLELKKSR